MSACLASRPFLRLLLRLHLRLATSPSACPKLQPRSRLHDHLPLAPHTRSLPGSMLANTRLPRLDARETAGAHQYAFPETATPTSQAPQGKSQPNTRLPRFCEGDCGSPADSFPAPHLQTQTKRHYSKINPPLSPCNSALPRPQHRPLPEKMLGSTRLPRIQAREAAGAPNIFSSSLYAFRALPSRTQLPHSIQTFPDLLWATAPTAKKMTLPSLRILFPSSSAPPPALLPSAASSLLSAPPPLARWPEG